MPNPMRRLLPIFMALLCLHAPSHALFGGGGGGIAGGSTEITQMLNNAELITSASKAMETAQNTMQQVMHAKQMLENLPAAAMEMIAGDAAPQMWQSIRILGQLQTTQQSYEQLAKSLAYNMQAISATNMTPSQYLLARAQLAKAKGSVYKDAVQKDWDALTNAQKNAQELDNQLQSNKQITSAVSGLQAVAQSNTKVLSAIQDMKSSMQAANAMAGREKQDQSAAAAAQIEATAAAIDGIKSLPKADLKYADPNSLGYTTQPLKN